MTWQAYVLSLGAGVFVGAIYGLLTVRSPAPPIIALLGLLGMLAGENLIQWIREHQGAGAHALQAPPNAEHQDTPSETDTSKDRQDDRHDSV